MYFSGVGISLFSCLAHVSFFFIILDEIMTKTTKRLTNAEALATVNWQTALDGFYKTVTECSSYDLFFLLTNPNLEGRLMSGLFLCNTFMTNKPSGFISYIVQYDEAAAPTATTLITPCCLNHTNVFATVHSVFHHQLYVLTRIQWNVTIILGLYT